MAKKLTLHCTQSMCGLLSDILRQYADAAYPRGGSECSQSARESLLSSAEALVAGWQPDTQSTTMSRRLRVMAKAAVEYHAQSLVAEEDLPAAERKAYLLSVFTGEAIDDVGYDAARRRDRSA